MLRRLTKIVGSFATTTTTVLGFRATVANTVLLGISGTRSNMEGTRSPGTKVCINSEHKHDGCCYIRFYSIFMSTQSLSAHVSLLGFVPGDDGGVARVIC